MAHSRDAVIWTLMGMLLQTARSKAIVLLRRVLRIGAWVSSLRYPELRRLLAEFRASRSAAVDLADAVALYRHVLTCKPQAILELGPGTSTNVIALAIRQVQNRDPEYSPIFVAIEENTDWLLYHEEKFKSDLRSCVDLIARDTRLADLEGEKAAIFDDIPLHPYDFIHVDGPDHFRIGVAITGDVVAIANVLAERVTIIFDGREASARFAACRLGQLGFVASRDPLSLNYTLVRSR